MDLLLRKAQAILPLPELLVKLGLVDQELSRGRVIPSPFRDDSAPSFSIYNREGKWRFKDHGTGEGGDEVDVVAMAQGIDNREARRVFLEMAGIEKSAKPTPAPKVKETSTGIRVRLGKSPQSNSVTVSQETTGSPSITVTQPKASWDRIANAFGDDEMKAVAEWRGYDPEFVKWLKDESLLGWYRGGPAMPIYNESGDLAGIHHRQIDDPSSWRITAGGQSPLVMGDPKKAFYTLVFESQWDAFAGLQAIGAHRNEKWRETIAFIASRGACNGGSLPNILLGVKEAGRRVAAVEQNDPPRADGKPTGNEIWCKELASVMSGVLFAKPPEEFKDVNDWLKAGLTKEDFLRTVESATKRRTTTLSLRTVEELRHMTFSDSDNYIGDRVLAAGQPTSFLGPGGIGKSRMVLQLAVCCILRRKFLNLETHAEGKRWLILQTENSNRRLQTDLIRLLKGLELTEPEIRKLNQGLVFHTIETDHDALLDLGDPDVADDVGAAVRDTEPDIVVLDPLNTFTSGDLNSDRDCRALLTAISQIVKKGNPDRIPFIVHHSLTGKAGASKAVGWDRGSYGRNSKVLHAWVRSQWNLAPADPDDETRLILACGKNNNGRPFEEVGAVLNEQTGIYEIDSEFDPQAYRESIGADSGKKKRGNTWGIDDVLSVMSEEYQRVGWIQRRFCEQTGASRARFYQIWPNLKDTSRVDKDDTGAFRKL